MTAIRISRTLPTAVALMIAMTAPRVRAQDIDISGMSRQEILEDSESRIEEMETVLDEVFALRDRTQNEDQDLTRVRCINDKVAALQGFLRLSTDSVERLREALAAEDGEAIRHQYTLVVIASQRARNLQGEANRCAGDILTFAGDTEQQSWIDPTIPDDQDLTVVGADSDVLGQFIPDEPLPESTPFQ